MIKKFGIIIIIISLAATGYILSARSTAYIRRWLVRELNKTTTTKIDLDSLRFNLASGEIHFSGLRIYNPPGCHDPYFLSVKDGLIVIDLRGLLSKKISVRTISVRQPEVYLELARNGELNAAAIFKKGGPHPAGITFPGTIAKVAVDDGRVKFASYQADADGASVIFDRIVLSVEDVRPAARANELPTRLSCSARLPAGDGTGRLELSARGNFISPQIDFDLQLTARNMSIPYFMPFYARTSPIIVSSGIFDLDSTCRCRDNSLNALQKVRIRKLGLLVNPERAGATILFGLPILNVINYFVNSDGRLDFEFPVTGTITDPQFKLFEALHHVMVKSIGEAILRNFSEVSRMLLENIQDQGAIVDTGKELIKNALQKILGL